MSETIPSYFFKKIGFYGMDFIRAYFVGGYNFFFRIYQNLFSRIERATGFIVNIRYFKIPLWKQYSFASYLISVPYRVLKIIMGAVLLAILTAVLAFLYICWVLLPVYLIAKTVSP